MPEIFVGNIKGPRGVQGVPGPKGDPFTFDDFTPEQLANLKGPQGSDGKDGVTPSVSFRYDEETGLLYYSIENAIDGDAEVW